MGPTHNLTNGTAKDSDDAETSEDVSTWMWGNDEVFVSTDVRW